MFDKNVTTGDINKSAIGVVGNIEVQKKSYNLKTLITSVICILFFIVGTLLLAMGKITFEQFGNIISKIFRIV